MDVAAVRAALHATFLWRSTMQLAVGAGFAGIMVAALAGASGQAIPMAEGRELLVPHVRDSALLVVGLYASYALVGLIALHIVGMTWFDAIIHSFGAVSTGGFSTHADSIGYYDSPAIDGVTIVLMFLGNLSFVTAWAMAKGRMRAVIRNPEVRLQGIVLVLASSALAVIVGTSLYPSFSKGVRGAISSSRLPRSRRRDTRRLRTRIGPIPGGSF